MMDDNSVWFSGGKNLTHHVSCPVLLGSALHATGGETCLAEHLVMCWCVSSDAECVHPSILLMMVDNSVWFAGGKNLAHHMFCPVVLHHGG